MVKSDIDKVGAARLRRQASDAQYWLLGEGPERRKLEWLARELDVAGKVTFFGSVPRSVMLEKLAECDAMAHPTLHDSGGWFCLEAMAAGCPLVCLDLGGPLIRLCASGWERPAGMADCHCRST